MTTPALVRGILVSIPWKCRAATIAVPWPVHTPMDVLERLWTFTTISYHKTARGKAE